MADALIEYLDRLLTNEAWASSGEEAAKHIREILGYAPTVVDHAAPDLGEVAVLDND